MNKNILIVNAIAMSFFGKLLIENIFHLYIRMKNNKKYMHEINNSKGY